MQDSHLQFVLIKFEGQVNRSQVQGHVNLLFMTVAVERYLDRLKRT